MQDLKTGHLLHASPRAQFYGQMLGSTLSIFVSATAYRLYAAAYSIPSPAFPTPTAYVWLSLARLLKNSALPPHSAAFMAWFSVGAAVVSATKVRANAQDRPWARWIPSGVAFAIGFLNTPNFSIARLIGGLLEFWWTRRTRGKNGVTIIIVASGFVLGEVSFTMNYWAIIDFVNRV